MADRDSPYERVKGGRLSFKGGELATNSKTIDKKKKKKKKITSKEVEEQEQEQEQQLSKPGNVIDDGTAPGEAIYTIDAAKKMKYEELFPVETKKFGYDPKAKVKSVEDALDDRIKKKADRYCK
ncbi:uncharacterized protein LOC141611499 [Silene latifolia]|uniref:uncharacterized protein LOC141611499 n=1 Tax=Silene latifolia TaxID=37657 RepID=UPI003D777A06